MESPTVENNKFYCGSCDKELDNANEYAQHLKSKKHRRMINSENEKEVQCKDCRKSVPLSMWEDHKNSEFHLKNANQKLQNENQEFFCSSCMKQLNTKNEYDQHLISKKHKRMTGPKKEEKKQCEDCKKRVPLSMWDDHLKSAFHLKHLNQKHEKETEKFFCHFCQKQYTNRKVFDKHLKSANHIEKYEEAFKDKVSCRICKKMVIASQFEEHKHIVPQRKQMKDRRKILGEDPKDQEQKRKQMYGTRPFENFESKEPFVHSVVSFLSLKLAFDPKTIDFDISINDAAWNLYGDIVIKRKSKSTGKILIYVIKFIHATDPTLNLTNFNELQLEKEFYNIKEIMDDCKTDIKRIRFVILTTRLITPESSQTVKLDGNLAKLWSTNIDAEQEPPHLITVTFDIVTKPSYVLNTPYGHVFCVNIENEKEKEAKYELPALYIHSGQKIIDPQIAETFIKNYFPITRPFFKKYNDFVKFWAREKSLEKIYYCLSKSEVIQKLVELHLEPYIIYPNPTKFRSSKINNWDKIIEKTDIILLKNEKFILTSSLQKMIEDCFNKTIDPFTKVIKFTQKDIFSHSDPFVRAYLYQEKTTTIDAIYRVFWKAGKFWLFLSLNDNMELMRSVLEVASLMKAQNVEPRFIIISKTSLTNITVPKNVTVFASVADVVEIIEKENVTLDNIKIRVSTDLTLSLKEISESDPSILKWVTPSLLFDMLSDRVSITKAESSSGHRHSDVKIVLNNNLREKVRNVLYDQIPVRDCEKRLERLDPTLC